MLVHHSILPERIVRSAVDRPQHPERAAHQSVGAIVQSGGEVAWLWHGYRGWGSEWRCRGACEVSRRDTEKRKDRTLHHDPVSVKVTFASHRGQMARFQ